jgi:3'(2'), 5'-bisphosphate nucleotidase
MFNASGKVMDYYRKHDLSIINKEDNSPVTEADFASNSFLTGLLNDIFPGVPVISEENSKPDYHHRRQWEYFWILDPLDGTREFISQNDEFAINLALIKRNKPVFGIIALPAKRTLFLAESNGGSWKVNPDGTRMKLPLKTQVKGSLKRKILVSRSHAGVAETKFVRILDELGYETEMVPAGSSYKHTLLAEGNASLYAKLGSCWEWDTAPGQLILEEAGGSVTRIIDGQPLVYNKDSFQNPDFIMWAPGVTPLPVQTLQGN